MVDQMTRPPTATDQHRPRRTRVTALVVAAVAAVAFGTWAVVEATNTDPTRTAGDLADAFLTNASANDSEAVAALFAEDGILVMVGNEAQGHAAIVADVDWWSPSISGWERVGDVVETEAGTFTFAARGMWHGAPHDGGGEIRLDGDLIARLVWFGATPAD